MSADIHLANNGTLEEFAQAVTSLLATDRT